MKVVIAALILMPVAALADDAVTAESTPRGQGWSMQAGRTVGASNTALAVQAGWPGLNATVLYGATPRVDIGARFNLNYGYEGLTNWVTPGIKLQGVARVALVENNRFNLGLEFAPGPLFYFGTVPGQNSGTTVGLALPFDFTLGIPVGSAILLHGGLDVPMWVTFGRSGGLYFPILIGGGVEYFIDKSLAATFRLRMGPSIDTNSYRYYGAPAAFMMDALIGVEYRL